jgi:hypothetical protein
MGNRRQADGCKDRKEQQNVNDRHQPIILKVRAISITGQLTLFFPPFLPPFPP